MTGTALVLGASGRFSRNAAERFRAQGWEVRTVRRPAGGGTGPVVDVFDPAALTGAARGVDVIINGLNPPYPDWSRDLPRYTRSVIAAAEATGATVLLPGNLYPYGGEMPEVLRPDTPHAAVTRKGRLRTEMEAAYRASAARVVLLRAGDYLDTEESGNWFESHLATRVHRGVLRYPGPMDRAHAWAFLPDVARAAEALVRMDLPRYADIPFPGYTLTGAELRAAVEAAAGRPVRCKPMPWGLMRLMALGSPLMREVLEMRYLWEVPHSLDRAAFDAVLPGFEETPAVDALRRALAGLQSKAMSTQTSRWSEETGRPVPIHSAPGSPGAGQKTPAPVTRRSAEGST